jgi:hypothetical protein
MRLPKEGLADVSATKNKRLTQIPMEVVGMIGKAQV